MDLIIETIRNVVLIVFFASVLEMFLPKSSMGRFVQLIMGLFVIITILNPAMNLTDKDFQLDILTVGKADQNLVTKGMNNGLSLKEDNQVLAQRTVVDNLEKQVGAIVNLVPGVRSGEVEVITDPDFINNGKISKILIQVKPEIEKEKGMIEAVQINTSLENKSVMELFPEETVQRVKETISNFYGLDARLVEILVEHEEEKL